MERLFENTKNELRQFRIKRKKRQAVPATKLRLRKELRMMSDAEIQLFFDAVNSAKANTVSYVLCCCFYTIYKLSVASFQLISRTLVYGY